MLYLGQRSTPLSFNGHRGTKPEPQILKLLHDAKGGPLGDPYTKLFGHSSSQLLREDAREGDQEALGELQGEVSRRFRQDHHPMYRDEVRHRPSRTTNIVSAGPNYPTTRGLQGEHKVLEEGRGSEGEERARERTTLNNPTVNPEYRHNFPIHRGHALNGRIEKRNESQEGFREPQYLKNKCHKLLVE
jgi:hypothetical protein